MARRAFRPSAGQAILLLAIGAASIGAALYVRYRIIEMSAIGLACDGGEWGWRCDVRKTASMLFNNSIFGYAALIAAVLNLLRPSVVLLAIALIAGGAGVVLYNAGLCGLALALLILSFARPAPELD